MRYLSEEDILVIHAHVLEASGGADGVRDAHLLASLVERPKVALFGAESFSTVFEKAAVYLESIARYHVFLDGNKRTAMVSCARFLAINEYELQVTRRQFVTCAVDAAVGKMTSPRYCCLAQEAYKENLVSMSLTLVTSNPNKVAEISAILGAVLSTQAFDIPEIQSFSLREMVKCKADFAFDRVKGPVLVEDVSFSLSALNGFPGPFVKFWEQVGGNEVAVQIVEKFSNARCSAFCGVGYLDKQQFLYAEKEVPGTFVSRRGTEGWGFDFYFIPDGEMQTYAEMGLAKKNFISHRRKAWEAMKILLEERHFL